MLNSTLATKWFMPSQPNPQAKVRLFCFPYAGGSGSIFSSWPKQLPSFVEVCPLHLPGRGSRFRESPYTHLSRLVEDTTQVIQLLLDKPFAFFGHSMGAIIGFELIRQMREQNQPTPFCFFASGRSAPHVPFKSRRTHDMDEPTFIKELRSLNGTPREILGHAELMRLMIPALRADFEMCETYVYTSRPPLTCAISAFGGTRDNDVKQSHLEAWRQQTSFLFSLHMFAGDHFFLNSAESQLLQKLSQDIYRFGEMLALD